MPVFTALLAFLGSISGYVLSERSKAKWQDREGKQTRYHALVVASKAFLNSPMSATERHQLAIQFMRERDLCGIYCPDEIVRQLNIFTDRISNPKLYDDQDLQYRMLKLALRKDLRDDTKLTEQDYKF
jgi:hypothetical protein